MAHKRGLIILAAIILMMGLLTYGAFEFVFGVQYRGYASFQLSESDDGVHVKNEDFGFSFIVPESCVFSTNPLYLNMSQSTDWRGDINCSGVSGIRVVTSATYDEYQGSLKNMINEIVSDYEPVVDGRLYSHYTEDVKVETFFVLTKDQSRYLAFKAPNPARNILHEIIESVILD